MKNEKSQDLNDFVDDNNKSTALTTFLNALQILIHLILTTTMLYCIMLLLLLLNCFSRV